MEQTLPNLPVGYIIRVLSVMEAGNPPHVDVEARGVRYHVAYTQPAEGRPLRTGDRLSVVQLGTMMMTQQVSARGDPEGDYYGLYEWRRL
jgi:hypothetical protein